MRGRERERDPGSTRVEKLISPNEVKRDVVLYVCVRAADGEEGDKVKRKRKEGGGEEKKKGRGCLASGYDETTTSKMVYKTGRGERGGRKDTVRRRRCGKRGKRRRGARA